MYRCALIGAGDFEGKIDMLVICSIWRTLCPDPVHYYIYYNFTTGEITKVPKAKFIKAISEKYAMSRGFAFDADKVYQAYYKFVIDTKQYYDGLANRHLRNPAVEKLLIVSIIII
jgi:hypothetical protein